MKSTLIGNRFFKDETNNNTTGRSYEAGHDKVTDSEKRNGYDVTIFKFCYTCPGDIWIPKILLKFL